MPTETLAPDAIISSTNLSGAVTDIDELVDTPYAANGVNFDGTNDYLTRGQQLTSVVDSPLLSGSVWFRRGTTGAAIQRIVWASNDAFNVSFGTANQLTVRGETSAGAIILLATSAAITDTASWHHACFAFDLTEAVTIGHMYVDGIADGPAGTISQGTIDFTVAQCSIGAIGTGTERFNGDLADLWYAPGVFIDFSNSTNRLKFRSAGGAPADLGGNGELPTGSLPAVFLSGPTSAWHTNLGYGGGFTMTGSITDSATDPP